MSIFSNEEKRHVLLFILENSMEINSMENEEKWQQLGREMNRDWKEIRNAYHQWKMMDDINQVISQEKDKQEHLEAVNIVEDCNFMEDFDVTNDVVNGYEDEIQYVNMNGELFDVSNFEEYLLDDTEVFNTTVYDDQGVVEIRKRELDLSDFNTELLKTFELQSKEELELKRKEHENKMKLYKMQLEFAAEVHKEKMKILKAKLHVIEEQVYHIDHVICNKNLKRKFKSGPI